MLTKEDITHESIEEHRNDPLWINEACAVEAGIAAARASFEHGTYVVRPTGYAFDPCHNLGDAGLLVVDDCFIWIHGPTTGDPRWGVEWHSATHGMTAGSALHLDEPAARAIAYLHAKVSLREAEANA